MLPPSRFRPQIRQPRRLPQHRRPGSRRPQTPQQPRRPRQEGLEPEAPEVQPQAQEAAAEAAAGAGQPGPVAPRVTEVVVEQGDTMSGIAAQFGVDLGALIATNADTVPNPDRIYPGQVLRLP